MGKSIIEPVPEFPFETYQCFLCGRKTMLEKHHVFAGVANRRISEREGFWCHLCVECHRGVDGAQYNSETGDYLKAVCQQAYEETHTHEEWMQLIRKNYLKEGRDKGAEPVSKGLNHMLEVD